MNQLFVARYTSSRNGVKADVIILLQSIEGDLGVLTHRILLAKCLGLVPQTQTSKAVAPLGRLPVQSRVISIHLRRWSAHFLLREPSLFLEISFIVFAIEGYPGDRIRARVDELIFKDGCILVQLSLKM